MTDGKTLVGTWNYPTPVRFGVNRIEELPDACRELGFEKPLLITDPVLAKLPLVRDTLAILARAGMKAGVFHDVQPNPVGENVTAGVEAFKIATRAYHDHGIVDQEALAEYARGLGSEGTALLAVL